MNKQALQYRNSRGAFRSLSDHWMFKYDAKSQTAIIYPIKREPHETEVTGANKMQITPKF